MDSSTEEILLQKIEELVNDEDKIITNSVLCEKFDVSLPESKHILKKYVSDESLNPGKISVTYLICGKLKTGEYSIQIVDSNELKEKKKLFSVVSNEVVYSVQKSNSIDFNAIALSEKIAVTKVPKGSIIGEKCSERLVKSKVLPPPPAQKNFEKQKSSMFFKPVVKAETNGEKKPSQSTSTNGSKTNAQKKPGGLASFFSQTPQNSNNENKHQLKAVSSDEDARETKRPRMESNDCKKEKIEVKLENEPENDKETDNDSKETISKNEEVCQGKTSDTKQASKKVTNKNKQEGKKRKRIILQSDSEDDLFANDEDERMNVDSEEEKPVITQPKEKLPKDKRRKAVEKVYTDDEGFVVTKTEYILVSASEDEESEVKTEEEKPKEAAKPQEKEEKKSLPQKSTAKGKKGKALAGNQTTLMSFFKKK